VLRVKKAILVIGSAIAFGGGVLLAASGTGAETVKRGPGPDYNQSYTYLWGAVDTTDDGKVNGPAKIDVADQFVLSSSTAHRMYAIPGVNYRIIRFTAMLFVTTTASNELCDFAIAVDDATPEAWSVIQAGAGGTPTCEFDSLTDADLDTLGEACTRFSHVGSAVPDGSYWQVVSNDRSGATDCENVPGMAFEVTVQFYP